MTLRSKPWETLLADGLKHFDLDPDTDTLDRLLRHADEMILWNKKTNLTAITEPKEVVVKHILDSAAPLNHLSDGIRLLDIGTGGGFPGLPLKLLNPTLRLTLMDASRKKVNFLKHVIRLLKLEGAEAIHARGESLSSESRYHGSYDCVICRAFSALGPFVSMALPYVRPGGKIIAMKAKDLDHETDQLKDIKLVAPDGRTITGNDLAVDIDRYSLPIIPSSRAIITIRIMK